MTYSRCTLQQSTVECISSLDLFNSSIIYIVCGFLGILLTHHEHINNLTYWNERIKLIDSNKDAFGCVMGDFQKNPQPSPGMRVFVFGRCAFFILSLMEPYLLCCAVRSSSSHAFWARFKSFTGKELIWKRRHLPRLVPLHVFCLRGYACLVYCS